MAVTCCRSCAERSPKRERHRLRLSKILEWYDKSYLLQVRGRKGESTDCLSVLQGNPQASERARPVLGALGASIDESSTRALLSRNQESFAAVSAIGATRSGERGAQGSTADCHARWR